MDIIISMNFSGTESSFLQSSPGHYMDGSGLNDQSTFQSQSLSLALSSTSIRNGFKIYYRMYLGWEGS